MVVSQEPGDGLSKSAVVKIAVPVVLLAVCVAVFVAMKQRGRVNVSPTPPIARPPETVTMVPPREDVQQLMEMGFSAL
eukprot:COSAG02_NODE_332_length_24474_cov_23.190949_17_plen_78_part_00